MLVVIQMTVQQAVPMVNLTAVMETVSMALGPVTDMVTALMAQMKPTVRLYHVKIRAYLIVVMASVSMDPGSVMDMQIVQMVVMTLTVLLHHVQPKVYGIVAMANVFQHHMYVMAQVNFVTQAGVLTVLMVQMKA